MTDKNLELNYFNAEYTAPRTLCVQVGSDVTPVDGLNYDIRLADATNMKGRVRSDFTIESFTNTDDVPVAVETVVPTNYITSANFSTSIYDDFRVTVVRQENNSFNVFVDVLEGENSFQVASKNTFNLFDIDLFYDNTKPFSELSSSSSSSAEEVEIRGINVFSTLSVADLATYGITVISQITSVQNSEGVYVTAGDWSKVTSVSIVKDAMKLESGVDFSDYREILDGGVIHRYRNDSIYALRQGRLYRRGYDLLSSVQRKLDGGSAVFRNVSLPIEQKFESLYRYGIAVGTNAFKIDDEANFNNSYFYSYDGGTKAYTRLGSWEEGGVVIKFVGASESEFNNVELDIYKASGNNFVLKELGDTYSSGGYFRIYHIVVPAACATMALMKFKFSSNTYLPFVGVWNTTDQLYRIASVTGSVSSGFFMSAYYASEHENNEDTALADDLSVGFVPYNTQLLNTYEIYAVKNSEETLEFEEGVVLSYSEGFVRDGDWDGWSAICCNGLSMLLIRNRRLYKYGAFPKITLKEYTYTFANGATETRKYAETVWVVYNSPVVIDTSETWDGIYVNSSCYGEYGSDFAGLLTIYAVKIDGSLYRFDNDTLTAIADKPKQYSSSKLSFGEAQDGIDNFKIWIGSDGRLRSLGNNEYGQLGRGYFSGYDTNAALVNSDLTSWTEVSCASKFAIGIADTQLYAWGKFKFDSEDEVTGGIDNFYDSPTLLDYGDGWSGLYVNSSDEVFAIKEQRVYKITPETQTLLSGDLLNFTSLVGQVSQEAPYADSAAVADLLDALSAKAFLTIRNHIDTSGDSSSSSSEDANELVDSVGIYFGKLNIISSSFNAFTFSFSYSRDVAATYDETIGDFAFADYQEHQFGQNELGVNTYLDAYLTATGGDFLSGQFIVYAAVKNVTSSGETGYSAYILAGPGPELISAQADPTKCVGGDWTLNVINGGLFWGDQRIGVDSDWAACSGADLSGAGAWGYGIKTSGTLHAISATFNVSQIGVATNWATVSGMSGSYRTAYARNAAGELYALQGATAAKIGASTTWETVSGWSYLYSTTTKNAAIAIDAGKLIRLDADTPTQIGVATNWAAVGPVYRGACLAKNNLGELFVVTATLETTAVVQVGAATNWNKLSLNHATTMGGALYIIDHEAATAAQVGNAFNWRALTGASHTSSSYALNTAGELYSVEGATATRVGTASDWTKLEGNLQPIAVRGTALEESSSSGNLSNYDVGVYVPLELEIIYYPNEITIARTDSKTKYINSSASRAKLPITSKYGDGVDALAIDYSSMSVVFEEDDATEWIEYAGENFIYVLENSDDNIYRVELPFGIPPASTAEGYTIGGIVTPSNANGFYQKSTDVAGYPCYILSGTNICMRYSSNVYNYSTGTYGGIVIASYNGSPESLGTNYFSTTNWLSTMGFDPAAFTWTANYESSGSPVFAFVPEKVEEGSKTLGIRLFDEYGNKSTIIENILIVIAQPSFTNVSLRLLGSSGNDGYTGFYERNGRFFPSDYVEMQFTCQSKLPLFYQIAGDVLCDTETIYSISESDTLLTKTVKADVGSITDTIIGKDTAVNITLRFIDDAGNEITASDSIQYISILHRFPHQNVKEDSESYHTTLYKKLGNSTTVLSQKTVSATEFTRNWEDYFWPSNHGYPLLTDGSIDEDTALRISLPNIDAAGKSGPTPSELAIYDRLVISGNNLSNASLVVDNEGRYSTVWTGTKYYTNNTNNRLAKDGLGMVYYIIDNTGRADFQLEFEHFDFDRNVTLLPRNIASPYDGDCLVIYDVSAPGCLSEDKRTFLDTSLMVEIMAFTGSYKNNSIVSLSNSASSFTSSFTKTATGFIAPNIINTSLIAVVPFTDSNFTASGFKLKAGPKQSVEYYNYELYNTLGEVWCHEASGDGSSYAGLTQVMATYSYYTSSAVVDHDRANIRFEERPANVILGSFTTYSYLYSDGRVSESPSLYFGGDVRKFLLYNDDLVDYNEPAICVVPSGTNANFVDIYDFSGTESLAGKLTSNYSMNKDKGVLTFAMGVVVPKGRLFANYFYHTLERLTNDGYHDLFFADAYLVPAVAADNAFKDWTHANLKIVNEGSAALTGGVLKFLARGYVSSANTVDTVLDENRPWDVQKGSSAETVSRTGGSANVTYENLPVPSRSNAVTAIGQGQSVSFGSLLPKDQVFIRVFWSLALNADGTQFVNDTTRGDKMWSAEMAGRYMTLEID